MNFDIFTILYLLGFVFSIIFTTNFNYRYILEKVIMYFFASVLFVLSAFRALDIGYDNVLHIEYFESISNGTLSIVDFQEPGYATLSYFITLIEGEYTLFLTVYSLISIILVTKVLQTYSIYPFLGLYIYYSLYFFHQNMSRLRMSMSVLILLYSINYLDKKKTKKFIFIVIVAASFHASALIFLILLPLQNITLNRKKLLIYFSVSIVLGLLIVGPFYREVIGGLNYNIFSEQFGLNRIVNHANRRHAMREGGWLGFLYYFMQAGLMVLFYERIKQLGSKTSLIYLINFVGISLYFIFFDVPVLGRLSIGFRLVEIIIASYYIQSIDNKYIKILFTSLYLLVVLVFGFLGFYNYYDSFVPFKFFFS
ncbi:EpsG family protein [Alkalibacterium olivapovliticus]|uniref:EpsG-like putative glucosyltransferase n=1 Tax=Alkalibacterium olivapovliticus TaxID=99907 RepID=A0A2T0W7I8_9LACT|nr:EpsG family protein [Alkalibacterium olivapovliticus]PRY82677.1 EpsG-like putative glucosyltransferase [Alkalibacterium olivapovliticus]